MTLKLPRGVVEIKELTRTHLLRKIKLEFNNSLKYTKDYQSNVLIYPENLTTEQLVRENQKLKTEIQDLLSKESNTDCDTFSTALKLRKSIQDQEKEEP